MLSCSTSLFVQRHIFQDGRQDEPIEFEIEELAAYHEAGHVVVSILMGGSVDRVSIDCPEDEFARRDGETVTRWPAMSRAQLLASEICVSLAGPVAEMLYVGETRNIADVSEWMADWHRASQSAAMATRSMAEAEQLLIQCQSRIAALFDQPNSWAAVSAVADELMAHEILDGEHVEDAVGVWLRRSS